MPSAGAQTTEKTPRGMKNIRDHPPGEGFERADRFMGGITDRVNFRLHLRPWFTVNGHRHLGQRDAMLQLVLLNAHAGCITGGIAAAVLGSQSLRRLL